MDVFRLLSQLNIDIIDTFRLRYYSRQVVNLMERNIFIFRIVSEWNDSGHGVISPRTIIAYGSLLQWNIRRVLQPLDDDGEGWSINLKTRCYLGTTEYYELFHQCAYVQSALHRNIIVVV